MLTGIEKYIPIENMLFQRVKYNLMQYVLVSKRLNTFIESFSKYPEKRRLFDDIRRYLDNGSKFKVCVLYGLRRTGKTVLIGQTLESFSSDEREKSAYIKADRNDSMTKLRNTLDLLYEYDIRNVFIDEASCIKNFTGSASVLSDYYAPLGMRIVLSGTDSLIFAFADENELYDRMYKISTTNILFYEHQLITGEKDIAKFIDCGGIFKERVEKENPEMPNRDSLDSIKAAEFYSQTAIADNIQHSLKMDSLKNRFGDLSDLYNKNILTNAISRVVNDISNSFTLDVLIRDFENILAHLIENAVTGRKDFAQKIKNTFLDIFESPQIIHGFMNEFSIHNPSMKNYTLSEQHVAQLREYLFNMNVLDEYDYILYSKKSGYTATKQILFCQPGLRFRQCEFFTNLIMTSHEINNLDLQIDIARKLKLCMLNTIRGRILEEIVLFETKLLAPDEYEIFRFRSNVDNAEYDMVIHNTENNLNDVYEIKFTDTFYEGQAKHFRNDAFLQRFTHKYGGIRNATVLYRGSDREVDGIRWRNIGNFLTDMAEEFPVVEEKNDNRLTP